MLNKEHHDEANAAISSYTFHSATESHSATASLTLPLFISFQTSLLQPLLLQPPPDSLWLGPLIALPGVLRVFLLSPAAPVADSVLLDMQTRELGALASAAGPHMPPVWGEVFAQAQTLMHAKPTSTDKHNKKVRMLALAFPGCSAGGKCLQVALPKSCVLQ